LLADALDRLPRQPHLSRDVRDGGRVRQAGQAGFDGVGSVLENGYVAIMRAPTPSVPPALHAQPRLHHP
jgi:hypothetical protein